MTSTVPEHPDDAFEPEHEDADLSGDDIFDDIEDADSVELDEIDESEPPDA